MKPSSQCLLFIFFLALLTPTEPAEAEPKRFKAADAEGVTASRDATTLYLEVDPEVKGPIRIPRLAAPVVLMTWRGSITDDGIKLRPEPDHWVINWNNRPAEDATLMIQFGSEPLLPEETKPIRKSSDGSFYLPAHMATTEGEKIRYEPQPYKNTVGFWAGKEDKASWSFRLDKPGRFNVAVLQGCGKGQGGSRAVISFLRPDDQLAGEPLLMEVADTGHWQNFQWRQLGEIELTKTGEVSLVVMPQHINKAALMDIRAIHLIRLPDKKK